MRSVGKIALQTPVESSESTPELFLRFPMECTPATIDTYSLGSSNIKRKFEADIEVINFGPLSVKIVKDPYYQSCTQSLTSYINNVFSKIPPSMLEMLANYLQKQTGKSQLTICLTSPENGAKIIREHTPLGPLRSLRYTNSDNRTGLFKARTPATASIHTDHNFIVYWLTKDIFLHDPERVIAHEIGHAVGNMLGSQFDKDLQRIHSDYLKFIPPNSFERRGAYAYTLSSHKEFWADIFGYALLGRFSLQTPDNQPVNFRHIIKSAAIALNKAKTVNEFKFEFRKQTVGM